MGNSASRTITQELTDELWVQTPIRKTLKAVQDSSRPTQVSRTDTLAPTSSSKPVKETLPEKAARKAAKQERKERRKRNREERLRREAIAGTDSSRRQSVTSPLVQDDDVSDSPSPSLAVMPPKASKSKSRARRSNALPSTDPDYAIDPSLREAQGAIQPAAGHGLQEHSGQKAPVASMHNTMMQDPEYNNMLPLIQAAGKAGKSAVSSQSQSQSGHLYTQARPEFDGASHPDTNQDEQGKDGKDGKKSKKRGRPKKKLTGASNDSPLQVDAQLRQSAEDGTEPQNVGLKASLEADTNATDSFPQAKKQKRRKRAEPEEAEEVDDADEGEPPAKKRKSDVVVDETGLTEKERELRSQGPLSKLEWRKVDEIIEKFKKKHNLEQTTLNNYIQSTKRAQDDQTKDLWARLYAALDHRTHVAVMRACRRRFNNYDVRGKWSTQDDDMLRQAYANNPGRWVKIGTVLGRMPEDCRDRWRNYLSCGDQRRIDDWTSTEEKLLRASVQGCAEALKQDAKAKAKEEGHAFREQDWESNVNFNVVSEKMDFTRSRLQCYTHWRVMQNRDPSITGSTRKSEGVSNRQGRALANFKKMKPGDKYEILSQIAEKQAKEDEDIPWKQINRENRQSRWTTRDRKETFIKLKSMLASDKETLAEALDVMLQHFRSEYPDQLEEVTPPEDKKQAEAGQFEFEASGYETAPAFSKSDNSVIDEDLAAEVQDQATESGQGPSEAVAQMSNTTVPPDSTSAKKAKKPKVKKTSKKSNGVTTESAEHAAPAHLFEDSEEERRAAAQQLGALAADGAATLAQHLQNANTAMLYNPYESAQPAVRDEAGGPMNIDIDAQTQAMQAAEAMQELVQSEALQEAPLPEELKGLDGEEERDQVPPLRSAPRPPKRAKKRKGARDEASEPASSDVDGFPWRIKRKKRGTT